MFVLVACFGCNSCLDDSVHVSLLTPWPHIPVQCVTQPPSAPPTDTFPANLSDETPWECVPFVPFLDDFLLRMLPWAGIPKTPTLLLSPKMKRTPPWGHCGNTGSLLLGLVSLHFLLFTGAH